MFGKKWEKISIAGLRITLGLTFLWAFFDKLLGLGFATCNKDGVITAFCNSAWISGGSPIFGFLNFGTSGPFAGIFKWLGTTPVVNTIVSWLFMLGLLGIGISLTFGIASKLGTLSATIFMALMWLTVLPKEHNPILDEHLVYMFAFVALYHVKAFKIVSLFKWWSKLKFVKKNKWLE